MLSNLGTLLLGLCSVSATRWDPQLCAVTQNTHTHSSRNPRAPLTGREIEMNWRQFIGRCCVKEWRHGVSVSDVELQMDLTTATAETGFISPGVSVNISSLSFHLFKDDQRYFSALIYDSLSRYTQPPRLDSPTLTHTQNTSS